MPARRQVKARVMPAQADRADELRRWWAYHSPDGPYPTRNLILTSALTKGLRRLDRAIAAGADLDVSLPPSSVVRDYPRVRFDETLMDFADRLRGPLYDIRCSQIVDEDTARPVYPSRASIILLSLQIGLDVLTTLYAIPSPSPSSLRAS